METEIEKLNAQIIAAEKAAFEAKQEADETASYARSVTRLLEESQKAQEHFMSELQEMAKVPDVDPLIVADLQSRLDVATAELEEKHVELLEKTDALNQALVDIHDLTQEVPDTPPEP